MEANPDYLLNGLTPSQSEAVVSAASPLCVVASAGSGKTRVLTRRIAWRCANGQTSGANTLALTFTRKAAAEMTQRLSSLGIRERVTSGTFHAVAGTQLRRYLNDHSRPVPKLLESKARILSPLLSARPQLADLAVSEVASLIEWCKARMIPPEQVADLAASRCGVIDAGAVAAVYRRYEDEKTRRGLMDFDDLLSGVAEAIESDQDFAAAVRWRHRHLYVDEFQDLNPLQHRLLMAWMGDRTDICLVGDPNQAIYGWNGADRSIMERTKQIWPSTETISLGVNHRCTPQVVRAAAAVLGEEGRDLTSGLGDGPAVTVSSCQSGEAEASQVAEEILDLHQQGHSWSSCAVLVRTNALAMSIAEHLRSAGVPVRLPGGQAFLWHGTTRQVLDRLKAQPALPLGSALADLREELEYSQDLEIPNRLCPANAEDRQEILEILCQLASEALALENAMSTGVWLEWLPSAVGRDPDSGGEAVTVCSFHRSKGLEWHSVWVCALEDGMVPIASAGDQEATAEERRLLYVALTRAGENLHCSWARSRTFGNRSLPRSPSPWLRLIGPDDSDHQGRSESISASEWIEAIRRRRNAQGPRSVPKPMPEVDPQMFEALVAWRKALSRASAVPGHVILHDHTLRSLAIIRPATLEALLEVPGMGPVKADRFGTQLLEILSPQAA